jgi:hypothetical protein
MQQIIKTDSHVAFATDAKLFTSGAKARFVRASRRAERRQGRLLAAMGLEEALEDSYGCDCSLCSLEALRAEIEREDEIVEGCDCSLCA